MSPATDARVWGDYLAGAQRSYQAHGVERALELPDIADGRSTSLVFAALAEGGRVVGGIRTQGPYQRAEQCHAVAEWEGAPDQPRVRSLIESMLPAGVVEIKTAWVADDLPGRRELVGCLCRSPIHAAALLGARYAMGTAAGHSVAGWEAAGAVVAAGVAPVAYPDERYRTQLAYFDRTALNESRTDQERRALEKESAQLHPDAVVPAQQAR